MIGSLSACGERVPSGRGWGKTPQHPNLKTPNSTENEAHKSRIISIRLFRVSCPFNLPRATRS